ncbi:MAG: CAP domain-containing protein [Bacteroidia bacterium]
MKNLVLLATLLLLYGFESSAQRFNENWYTELSVDSFFNTEAAQTLIDIEKPDIALLNAAIFFATNEARQKRNLPLLVYDEILEKAAEFHSNEMVEKRFFNHVNKTDKENRTFEMRIRNKGGEFTAAGENILEMPPFKTGPKGEYDVSKNPDGSFSFLQVNNGKPLKVLTYGDFARAAVKIWMKSPDHKANIMSKNFTHLGCGTALEDNPFHFKSLPMVLVTQNFGSMP